MAMNQPERPDADFLVIPHRGPRLTLLAVGYGGLLLWWLSWEDTAIWPVIALAAGLAVLVGLLITIRTLAGRHFPPGKAVPGLLLWGALAGVLWGITAALLMVLKTAAHGHLTPDYPLPVIGATLARIPAWSVSGALLGLGFGLLRIAHRASRKSRSHQAPLSSPVVTGRDQ